jgi:uncharacterized membrane protein
MMKKWIPWIGGTLLAIIGVAIVVNLILVIRVPNDIMEITLTERFNYPGNQWIFAPPSTAKSRAVVRPSADLLYSICCYDISQHPLRLTAVMSDYWAISGFSMNSDNFFVINDKQANSNPIEVVLIPIGSAYQDPTGKAHVIEAPSSRGIILIGAVVTNKAELTNLIQIQRQATIEPVN